MPFDEDLEPFLDAETFADAATIGSATVNGIFDEDYIETQEISGYRPVFTCASSDVTSVSTGDSITVGGRDFTVAIIEPENQQAAGCTRLVLSLTDDPDPPTWEAIAGADFELGVDIPRLIDIATSLAGIPILGGVSVAAFDSDADWWITQDEAADEFDASLLTLASQAEITATGLPLLHDEGLSESDMDDAITGTRTYLEGLIGTHVKLLAYPEHRHDRVTMKLLRDNAWQGARDGYAIGIEGCGSFLVGSGENVTKTWLKYCPWEIPTQPYLENDTVNDAATKAELYDWLYDTANNQVAGHICPLYGYGSLMELWKANHTLAPYYTHDEVLADNLQWLLEIMRDDDEVWVGTFSDLTAWAKIRHRPTAADELIWEPRPNHEASDYGDAPWNGKKMAFVFCTDDGRLENYTSYRGICQAVGVEFTAFIMDEGENELSEAQIQALHASGICEIACHAKVSKKLIRHECCKLVNGGSMRIAAEIVTEASARRMKFYKDSDGFEMSKLTNLEFAFEPWTISASENDRIGSYTCPYTAVVGTAADNHRPVYKTGQIDGLPALEFLSSEHRYLNLGNLTFWDNTRGLTVFCAVKALGTEALESFLSKYRSGGGYNERAFNMRQTQAYYSEDGIAADSVTWGAAYEGAFHLFTLSWIPGVSLRVFVDGVFKVADSTPPSQLHLNPTVDAFIGSCRIGDQYSLNGPMAGLWMVSRGLADDSDDLSNAHDFLLGTVFPSLAP